MKSKGYFVDTSALFKRYVDEKGSQSIDKIFSENAQRYISSLTLVEVIANLRRLVDVDRILNEEEFSLVKGTFLSDIKTGVIEVIETTTPILLRGLNICSEAYVTPIDAIQLATVLETPQELLFVCSDKKLINMAGKIGLVTLNPEEAS